MRRTKLRRPSVPVVREFPGQIPVRLRHIQNALAAHRRRVPVVGVQSATVHRSVHRTAVLLHGEQRHSGRDEGESRDGGGAEMVFFPFFFKTLYFLYRRRLGRRISCAIVISGERKDIDRERERESEKTTTKQ